MNILPKKRWHVRTKDNIARVRRDEANAAEEERQIKKRAQLAEQEARTSLLRYQARGKLPSSDASIADTVAPYDTKKHVNLATTSEEGLKSWGSNKEWEEEKKEEKEKYEKSIGLLTYLGQSVLDSKGEQPWYSKPRQPHDSSQPVEKDIPTAKVKTKEFLDPLNNMKKYLHMKMKDSPKDKSKSGRSLHQQMPTTVSKAQKSDLSSPNKRKHKHKKRKSKKHKHVSNGSDSDSSHSRSQTTIEQLRAERLRREKEERIKTEKLLAKLKGETAETQPEPAPSDGKQQYNSQFNPHLAKKPRIGR